MTDKIKQVLSVIIDKFKNNDIPQAIAYSMFPIPDVPSAKWSLLNRTLMFLSGTHDARGYKQWNEVDRHVKKGSKAFHILVPYLKSIEDDETGEESHILKGFFCGAVFRYEDTEGTPLDYAQLELPELPLIQRAEEWGLSVNAIPGNYSYYGYYSSSRKEIALATKDECVFFHELAHCGHEKIIGNLKPGQDPLQEIVAELSAQALCRMVGKQPGDSLGNSYSYIERYAAKLKLSPHNACLKVMSETEKVLNLILKGSDTGDAEPAGKESQAVSLSQKTG
jgi:hypothetical protein